VGPPNAGKSSLLNALSGQDSAIVTEVPGTTRDVLREWIDLDGIPVHVADTAGIRETSDVVEAEGVRRARQALESADLVLLVEDAADPGNTPTDADIGLPEHIAHLRIRNKMDLIPGPELEWQMQEAGHDALWISAKTSQGVGELRRRIREAVGAAGGQDGRWTGSFSARQRHIDALQRARDHLERGRRAMIDSQAGELLAEELRLAQRALGELTGEVLPDDLLGEIFSSFCIGK
jgi:tRNA modification GTPase